MKRPTKKQIERVVEWLELMGVNLYGPNMDADTGQEFCSLMDYDVGECIKRYNHIKRDTLWRDPNVD